MSEEEADHPPADYATRMRRAMNLGAEIDKIARLYRYNEERRYWGQKDYHILPRQRRDKELS